MKGMKIMKGRDKVIAISHMNSIQQYLHALQVLHGKNK
jgi:hypothetical protein